MFSHIKYVICPNTVCSRTDGDLHFISYHKLVRLYGVDPKACIDYLTTPDKVLNLLPEDVIYLHPRYSGDYSYLRSLGGTNEYV